MFYRFFKRLSALCIFAFLAACGSDYRNGSYTIGFDPSWVGIDLMGQQNNVTGFSRDLLKEIGRIEKTRLSLLPVSWDVLVPNLKSHQYDAILSSIYPYLFNQTYFDFSDPYLLTGPVLVLPISSMVTSIAQLNGKEIATLPDTNAALYLEKNPTILIRNYDSTPDAFNAVAAGMVDGAVAEALIANAYCRNIYNGKLQIATHPFNDNGLRVLTRSQTSLDLLKAIHRGLNALKKNGTYDALLKKWSLNTPTAPTIPKNMPATSS
ncbi:MAG: amino acid ABC transporter substrate-binding protein [Simkania sp.]|nr:amino acid ABC transporter substrate-binding protein [Simkania sp.]